MVSHKMQRCCKVSSPLASCMVSSWISDSSMYCQVSAGTGTGLSVLVYSGGQLGGMTNMFDYLQPQWDRTQPDHGPSTGAFSISIFGLFFGQVESCPIPAIPQPTRCVSALMRPPSSTRLLKFVLETRRAKRASGSPIPQFDVKCIKVSCMQGCCLDMLQSNPSSSPIKLCVNHAVVGVGSGLKLDFSLRTQFNITRRLLGQKSEISIVRPSKPALLFASFRFYGASCLIPIFRWPTKRRIILFQFLFLQGAEQRTRLYQTAC